MSLKDLCKEPKKFNLNGKINHYFNHEGLCDYCSDFCNFCVLRLYLNDCSCEDWDSAVFNLLEIFESCGCMDLDKAKSILDSKLLEEQFYSFNSLRSKYLRLKNYWKNGFDSDYIDFLTFNNSDINYTSIDKQKEVFDKESKEYEDELSKYMLKFGNILSYTDQFIEYINDIIKSLNDSNQYEKDSNLKLLNDVFKIHAENKGELLTSLKYFSGTKSYEKAHEDFLKFSKG
jgi:hypothetical protein